MLIAIEGSSHELCGPLKKELWNDKHVKLAGYHIKHPLIGVPYLLVETDGADPRKVLVAAATRLDKAADKLKASAKKIK